VTTGDGTTDLTKRYSEFEAFHKATNKHLAGVSFPGKSLFGGVDLDLRTTDLNKFMEEVCSRPMPADSQAALKAFVSGGAVGTGSPAKTPAAPQLFGVPNQQAQQYDSAATAALPPASAPPAPPTAPPGNDTVLQGAEVLLRKEKEDFHVVAMHVMEKRHTAALEAREAEHAVLVGDLLDQISQSKTREKALLETIRIQQEESESAAELVSSNSKFIAPALVLGQPVEIAYGLKELLGVSSQTVGGFLIDAMSAIRSECEAVGLEEDKQNLQHILAGTQKGGWEATKSIDELLAHSSSKLAHLEKHHVVALRMYTSSSFKTINDSLRKRVKPHPLPATTYFISEALKLLNAVSANQPDANMSKHLWRGMKNLKLSFEFLMQGGTELACLSTSESEDIAFRTFADSECPLLFKIVSKDFNTHGASIDFLSVFPSEKEILYPPLTFMRCLGTTRKEVKNAQGQMVAVLVAEVELVLA
jgi:hypothetical protein